MRSLLLLLVAFTSLGAQTLPVTRDNPNYPKRNPFYFEGRITWELLGIDVPRDTWEYVQRGIHKQDDLEDTVGAIADYKQAIALSNVASNTCQLVTTKNSPPAISAGAFAALTPPPCMFTPRLRLANLLLESDPNQAIDLFQQVLDIDPMRLGVNQKIGEAYVILAGEAKDASERTASYQKAVGSYQAELALTPINALTTKLTGDEAANPHVHWALAEVYEKLGQNADAVSSLQNYLKATKWHSDTYPWRITLAQKRIAELQSQTWGDQLPGATKGKR